jgi:hypothetical protein
MRVLVLVLTFAAICVASCSDSQDPLDPVQDDDPLLHLQPTEPMALSPGNAGGQDEDPAILMARDGSLFAAWYSNRAGLHADGRQRKELFVTRSVDGATWTSPFQVTDEHEWSFYPSLAQGADGAFHLAWMRWRLLPDDCVPSGPNCPGDPTCCTGTDRRIRYLRSSDGLAWDPADAVELTPGPADEVPSLVAALDGRLLVYYASGYRTGDPTKQIWVVVGNGGTWSAPVPASGVSTGLHHDTFPNVVERSPGSFLMTWTRYDLADGDNLFSPSTRTMLSTSTDGIAWTAPVSLNEATYLTTIDVFPHLYPDHARQNWFVAWVTESGTVELRVGGTFPDDLAVLEIPGYTPRVLPTATPGIYWAAWAEGVDPLQKVRHRFFAK